MPVRKPAWLESSRPSRPVRTGRGRAGGNRWRSRAAAARGGAAAPLVPGGGAGGGQARAGLLRARAQIL